MEAFDMIGAFDDLDGPVTDLCQCLFEFTSGIAAIGEDVTESGEAGADIGEHQRRAVTVLYIGSMDNGMDQIAIGISDDMALATLHLLTRIIAAYPATLGGFNRLAVDHTGTGRGFAALFHTRALQEIMIDPRPCAIVAPSVKIMLHRSCWRKAPAASSAKATRRVADKTSPRQSCASAICADDQHGKVEAITAQATTIQRRSYHLAKQGLCVHVAPGWYQSTSLISGSFFAKLQKSVIWQSVKLNL